MNIRSKNGFLIYSTPILLFVFLLGFTGLVSDSVAQWSVDPTINNPVVTLDNSTQRAPVIVSDGSRGVMIVWEDTRNEIDLDIYGQRILESGLNAWPGNGADIAVADEDQEAPHIAVSKSGQFFVAWLDQRNLLSDVHVLIQGFSRNGASLWPTATTAHLGNNSPPRIAFNLRKELVTSSYLSATFDDVISFQVTDTTGVVRFERQLVMNDSARGRQPELKPPVAVAINGGAIAAWADTRMANTLRDTLVYVTGITPNGTSWSAGEFAIGESIARGTYPEVVSDGRGGAFISWIEPIAGSLDDKVRITRIDSLGNFVWTALPIVDLPTTVGKKTQLRSVTDGRQGTFLMWQLRSGANQKLYAQRVRDDGDTWSSNVAISNGMGTQVNAQLVNNSNGTLLSAWEDDRNGNRDIFAQAADSTGLLIWNAAGVAISTPLSSQTRPVIASDGLGGATIAWQDNRNGTLDIYAQRINKTGSLGEFRTVDIDEPAATDEWEIGSSRTVRWRASVEIDSVRIELSRDGGERFETLFEGLSNDTPQNNQAVVTVVNGPPSDNCVLRITAIKTPFIRKRSQTFRILNTAGPELTPNIVSSADIGIPMTVTSTVLDKSGIQEVLVNYRVGGKSVFETSPMLQTDADTYSGAVPSESVTERGLEYFITATDVIGAVSNTDTFNVTVRFPTATLTKQIALGNGQAGYRMISSPNLLGQGLADSVFAASGFGVYDTTSYRLFEYRDAVYVERDSASAASFRFTPGQAYWLISARTRTVDFGRGQTVPVGQNSTVTLAPGWNQVGNPFAFSVGWEDVVSANSGLNISRPNLYRGSYIIPAAIEPFEGYFIFNFSEQNVTLRIPEKEFIETEPLAKNGNGMEWEVRLLSSCQDAKDEFNFVGIHREAGPEWDRFEQPEPPPIGDFVSLYFPQQEWQRFATDYSTDYRPEIGRGQIWEFHVKSNMASAEVELEFRFDDLPGDLQIRLLDEKLSLSQDLAVNSRYYFPTGATGADKALKLIVGRPGYVAETLADAGLVPTDFELSQNFPNPFNPTTSIRYGLPGDHDVTIRIFDVLGREVLTLVDKQPQRAGYHVINWDGRDKASRPVASGLYVYHISAGKFSQARKMLLVK